MKNIKREISIDYIQKVVSDYFQLDTETLKSKTRKRHIVQARQLAMYFSKNSQRHHWQILVRKLAIETMQRYCTL